MPPEAGSKSPVDGHGINPAVGIVIAHESYAGIVGERTTDTRALWQLEIVVAGQPREEADIRQDTGFNVTKWGRS